MKRAIPFLVAALLGAFVVAVIAGILDGCVPVRAIREPQTGLAAANRVTDAQCGARQTVRDWLVVSGTVFAGLGAGVPPVIAVLPSGSTAPTIALTTVGVVFGVAGVALSTGAALQANAVARDCTTRSPTP